MSLPELTPPPPVTGGGEEEVKTGWQKFCDRVGKFFGDGVDQGKWLENMRGNLSLTASIIATMTFQLATNPPGGVVQVSLGEKISCNKDHGSLPHSPSPSYIDAKVSSFPCPGEAVLGVLYQEDYLVFLIFNTVSFVSSLSVCLLLVSGIPLKHRFVIWTLSVFMCTSITSLALTFFYAASMVTPDPLWDTATGMFGIALKIWFYLLGFVGIFFTLRVLRRVDIWIRMIFPKTIEILRAAYCKMIGFRVLPRRL